MKSEDFLRLKTQRLSYASFMTMWICALHWFEMVRIAESFEKVTILMIVITNLDLDYKVCHLETVCKTYSYGNISKYP